MREKEHCISNIQHFDRRRIESIPHQSQSNQAHGGDCPSRQDIIMFSVRRQSSPLSHLTFSLLPPTPLRSVVERSTLASVIRASTSRVPALCVVEEMTSQCRARANRCIGPRSLLVFLPLNSILLLLDSTTPRHCGVERVGPGRGIRGYCVGVRAQLVKGPSLIWLA